MEFRPCIDIHNGQVKQIVGGSLSDEKDNAKENFVSEVDASFYANLYSSKNIRGGHVIILNNSESPFYEASVKQAYLALNTYPKGLQIGGGVNPENAANYLDAGASHVIVTSYVFKNGEINMSALERMVSEVGKEHLVLDLSCRKKDEEYMIVTDRWQKYTNMSVNLKNLDELSTYCDEYLIHAVDVEGKASGIEKELVEVLGAFDKLPITYAGGIHSFEDLELIKKLGNNHVNATIGSAMKIFGGSLELDDILKFCRA